MPQILRLTDTDQLTLPISMPEFLVHTTTRGVANAIKEEVKKKTPPRAKFFFLRSPLE